jgi:prepilin-type N-terminal cleavage/methylation domain-containing protein
MTRTRSAFSLLELVMVIAIGAFIAGIAIPRMGNATTRYQADYAAKRLASDLERAKANARLTGAAQTVTFSTTTHKYTVSGSGTGGAAGFTVDLSATPYKAKLTQVATVTYDAYGQGPSGGATIKLSSGGQVRTITVDASSGKASWN